MSIKKIVLFKCGLSSGGAEHQLVYLANGLVRSGYDVTVVTFVDLPDHYPMDSLVHRVRLAEGKNKLLKGFALISFYLSVRCDVVISFGQRESVLCSRPLLFRPSISIIAGERNLTFGKASTYERSLLRFWYKRATWIVSNSYSQMEHLVSLRPDLKKKIRTIINYTDINHFTESPVPNNKCLQVAVFARFDTQKNYQRFATALKMGEKGLSGKIHFVWYGNINTTEGRKNEGYIKFRNIIEEYKIGSLIVLRDHVKDVASEMQYYDAICLPSLFEGFSNSIAEAISCGKPMLVSDVSDNKLMVHQGENGFLFNPLKEESIVGSLLSFVGLSREERVLMGKKSREIAESLFADSVFIKSYIKLIESC